MPFRGVVSAVGSSGGNSFRSPRHRKRAWGPSTARLLRIREAVAPLRMTGYEVNQENTGIGPWNPTSRKNARHGAPLFRGAGREKRATRGFRSSSLLVRSYVQYIPEGRSRRLRLPSAPRCRETPSASVRLIVLWVSEFPDQTIRGQLMSARQRGCLRNTRAVRRLKMGATMSNPAASKP